MKHIWISILMATSSVAGAATTASIKNAKGLEIGSAKFTEIASGGVLIEVEARDLPPGEHAMHVHEKGACEAPKFESAGGHFAPHKNPHGFEDKKGPHAGDMPNVMVAPDGRLKVQVVNAHVTLGPGENSLLRSGGTALIIHEKADDYKTQPTGNAGGRLACGVITSR